MRSKRSQETKEKPLEMGNMPKKKELHNLRSKRCQAKKSQDSKEKQLEMENMLKPQAILKTE
jgi:hypothetical protein